METTHPERLKKLKPLADSTLLSYSQVFFSMNKVLGGTLMAVSFFSLGAGFGGLWAVVSANMVAWLMGFNRQKIISGLYGFNSLLTGLALSIWFEISPALYIVIFFASVLTLFVTIALEGVLYKYALSYLSLPFLVSVWVLTLAVRTLAGLDINPGGAFMMNEMYRLGGQPLVSTYTWFGNLDLPEPVTLYFRSLGAIFFQYYLFAGVLIAAGLLYYSRIAFVLSVLGFASAWGFYKLLGGNLSELTQGYIGFNFILTAIAVGGFFTIASPWTFLWVILLSPLVSFTISAGMALLAPFQLPVYSLPFNVVVLLFLYILKFREGRQDKPALVAVQQYSPEKNLYSRLNYDYRFGHPTGIYFSLPFFGEWSVTQGHNGEITHQEAWRHAWDFEIKDADGLTYTGKGLECRDYFCYGKPVLAPAGGYITEIVDGVADNLPGAINQAQNWGNTIILKHSEGLYTKLSHLKKGSIRVAKGAWVNPGEVVAETGNSGRSPYPHLHFQIQSTPWVGSHTLLHPLSNYISFDAGNQPQYNFSGIPAKNMRVCNIQPNPLIEKAFRFTAGEKLTLRISEPHHLDYTEEWEVKADIYNQSHLLAPSTGSKAWFIYAHGVLCFTHYEGDFSAVLYDFFIAHYKVIPAFYKGLTIHDQYPIHALPAGGWRFIQDFVAPFRVFTKASCEHTHTRFQEHFSDAECRLQTKALFRVGKRITQTIDCETTINNQGLHTLAVRSEKRTYTAFFEPVNF